MKKSGLEWIRNARFRDLEEVGMEIEKMLKFMKINSLFKVFWDDDKDYDDSLLTRLLNFAKDNVGFRL